MKYKAYITQENAAIPAEIAESLKSPGANTATAFGDKNLILADTSLKMESGFSRMKNGDYLVSMYTPMPGVTAEMIQWWFWWHPQEKERYQLWFPGEHFGIGYDRASAGYFAQEKMPPFLPNTQYPTERIGKHKMPLSIAFVRPEEFGFDRKTMYENHVAIIVCGHVGAFRGIIQHTEMAHICFQQDDGLFMASRFWLGKRAKNPLVRKALLTDDSARRMAEHCCIEYRNLAKKLPALYREFCGNGAAVL